MISASRRITAASISLVLAASNAARALARESLRDRLVDRSQHDNVNGSASSLPKTSSATPIVSSYRASRAGPPGVEA